MASSLQKSDPIIILGAGVFGLSTAIHLAQRGYKNVTVLDKQSYDKTVYSYDQGCDAASADINKIMRCAYGSDTIYQNMALDALESWKAWNYELANTSAADLPAGLAQAEVLYVDNGHISITESATLPEFEQLSLENITAAGHGGTQYVVNNLEDVARAKKSGFEHALDPFYRKSKGCPYNGLLDTSGGFVYADKACRFALYKARSLGVRFLLGPAGTFKEFLYSSKDTNAVTGVCTADGVRRFAALTVVACGGWTPSILPELDGLCETTAGSVCFFQIPRTSPLWDRFAPEKFPSYSYAMRAGAAGGIYGFPRDEDGIMKIGYRGTKYTNPVVQIDGQERSVPLTRWTTPESITSIPAQALKVVRTFARDYMPELSAHGIDVFKTRLCWYNDSFDNHLVIDRVPSRKNLIVATGGSGHAFKYLPVLGKWIVDLIEGKGREMPGAEGEVLRRWQWRKLSDGVKPYNVLLEGSRGERTLSRQELVADSQLQRGGGIRSHL